MKLKKRSFIVKSLALALVMMLAVTLAAPVHAGGIAEPSDPPTEEEIADNITAGLQYLANAQYNVAGSEYGAWRESYYVGVTGLAVLKFETHATFMGMSPLDPAYEYSDNVAAGLDFIFANTHNVTISAQTYGDPDANGNGVGVTAYHPGQSGHEMYEAGIALMAICASNEPNRIVTVGPQTGRTYAAVAQDMVDFIAFGQNEGLNAADPDRGGWRYTANYGNGATMGSDNSITGYVTIGLAYAEAPSPWGFGLTIPAFVFSELERFIDKVQDPVNGDDDDGGSWYIPQNTYWGAWVNCLKTGNLLSELAFVGAPTANTSVQAAIDYMERNWNDPNDGDISGEDGWYGTTKPSYQSCFTMMKGFQALGIETINATGTYFSWYDAIAERICNTQNPDGSWSGDPWGGPYLSTAWAMLALEKAAPPALLLLPPFDINQPGQEHTVTAVYKIAGVPQEDVEIEFEIISGPNDDEPITSDNTNASGEATFSYIGDGGEGTDTIKATAVQSGLSSQATKVWERTTPPVEVGGEVYAVNKLAILAPWVALFALLIPAIIVMRRRRARS